MNDRELRCYSGEVRAEQQSDQPTRIIGYGSVFNSRSEPLWGFREIIKPGAFDDVLTNDVRGLFNHDPNFILGRSAAGTLSLSVDERGLQYDILAPDTQTIRDLVIAPMVRGDISQSSFAFRWPVMVTTGTRMKKALLSVKSASFPVCTMSRR
jgi:HK97 family phage prohead protease